MALHYSFNEPETEATQCPNQKQPVVAVLKASGKRSQAQGYAPSLHRQESRVKITDNFQDHVVLLKERVAIDDLSHQLSFLSLRGQLLLLLNGLNRFASDLPHDLCLGHRPVHKRSSRVSNTARPGPPAE